MYMIKTQIDDIVERSEYQHYGVRVASKITDHYREEYVSQRGWRVAKDLRVGQRAPQSRVWVYGTPKSKRLGGASALSIVADYDHAWYVGRLCGVGPKRRVGDGGYRGDQIVLLGCDYAEEGEDRGEIVMHDARVLATWTRTEFIADCGQD